MAGFSKLELAVETGKWEGGLKKAQQALSNFQNSQGGMQQALTKNSSKMTEFIKIMGNTKSTAATASGQMKEYKAAIERLQLVSANLNGEQKKLADESIQKLIQRYREAKQQADSFGATLDNVSKKAGKGINFGALGNIGGMSSGIMSIGAAFGVTTSAALGFGLALKNNIETAKNFEYSISKLSSLTGMVGEDLDTLKRKAIELGSTTTQSASQAAEAMAIIGSKRPDLLSSAYALSDVTKAAITMSEAAGMDVPAAAESLSAALNIFQLDSSEATRVINVLAAGSKLGAANIEELGIITFRAGGMAKKAGLSFEEFAAAAETIRPAFGSAEDAGVALNKFLMKLESKMSDQYKPSVVGFAQAMRNLRDAHMDSNQAIKTFTVNGVKAYDAIMANVDGLEKLTEGVTGTNIAEEQAATNVNNLRGSMNQLSSAWEGFNLAMNDSNGALKTMVDWLTQAVTWATNTFTQLGRIKKKMDEINEAKGNGKQDGMQHDLARLRGSNHKEIAAAAIENEYIREKNKWADMYKSQKRALEDPNLGGQEYLNAKENLKKIYEYYKAADNNLKEWRSRSKEILNGPKVPTGGTGTGNEDLGDPNTGLLAEIAKNSKAKTPQEKAAERVEAAQLDYAQTIEKADIRMQNGLDDTLDHKKKELSAQERLFDAYSDAYAMFKDPKYKEMLDESATAIGNLSAEVKGLEEAAANAKDVARKAAENAKEIAKTRAKDNEYSALWDGGSATTANISGAIKEMKDVVSNTTIGTDIFEAFYGKIADATALQNLIETTLTNGISLVDFNTEELWQKILSGEGIPDETWIALTEQINAELEKLDINPIVLNVKTGAISNANKQAKDMAKNWSAAASMMGTAAQALNSFENPAAKIAGMIAETVAALAAAYATNLAQDKTTQGNIWAFIAAAAAATVSMGITISQVKKNAKMANGGFTTASNGVIGGNTFSGDVQPLLVNAGEGVINQADQAALWRSIKEGNFGGGGSIQSVGVRGTDLLLCLNNELRSQGKPTL